MTAGREAEYAAALADHFIMWRALYGPGPSGQWFCSCGLKFGFSDSAIDHVAAVLAALPDTQATREAIQALADEWQHDSEEPTEDEFDIGHAMASRSHAIALRTILDRIDNPGGTP